MQKRLGRIFIHDHWSSVDGETLRGPVLMVFVLGTAAGALHGYISQVRDPLFWLGTGSAFVMCAAIALVRPLRFHPWHLVPASMAGLLLLVYTVLQGGSLPLLSLFLVQHITLSGIFFKPRTRSVLQVAAIAAVVVLYASRDSARLTEVLAVLLAVTVTTNYFLERLLRENREQAREIRHHRLIGATARAVLDKSDAQALDTLCQRTLEAFGATECMLYDVSDDRRILIPRAFAAEEWAKPYLYLVQRPLQMGEGITGWVAKHNKPVLSPNIQEDYRMAVEPFSLPAEFSAMVSPVPGPTGEVAGVFRVVKAGVDQYSQEDFELFRVWAAEVGHVLQKQAFANRLERIAITDSLSGAYNRHYLTARWQDVVSQSAETRKPVTLLMTDCDNLKQMNARHGHATGDNLLRHLGQTLVSMVPPDGFVVRYGGDEFLVVLPGLSLESGNGLRASVMQALDRGSPETGLLPPLAVEIGVFSGNGAELHALLARIDASRHGARPDWARHASIERMTQAISTLTRLQEVRNPQMTGSIAHVQQLAMQTANELSLGADTVQLVGLGAAVHDVGEMALPEELWRKPGALTEAEWALVRMHPELGANIVGEIDLLREVKLMILYHHERYDGVTVGPKPGYPLGLKGEGIPLGARILAVTDAFDALTSHRPFRPAMSPTTALEEIRRASGTQFDPAVVAALQAVLNKPRNIGAGREGMEPERIQVI